MYDIALDKNITVGNSFLIPKGEEEDVLRIPYLGQLMMSQG